MSFASELRQVRPSPQAGAGAPVREQTSRALAVPTSHPFGKAFAAAGITYIVATAILLPAMLQQLPVDASSYALGYATVRALAQFIIAGFVPALIIGMVVSQSPRRWRFPGHRILGGSHVLPDGEPAGGKRLAKLTPGRSDAVADSLGHLRHPS